MRIVPRIIFTKSNILGGAGSYNSEGIMAVATDFPLWFVCCIFLHELFHHLEKSLPISMLEWKVKYTMKNENFAHYMKKFLTPEERERTNFNFERWIKFRRWQLIHFGRYFL